jgi:hypothetical protein
MPSRSLLALLSAGLVFLTMSGEVLSETPGLRVTGIRAYADGNMHVFFDNDVSDACGSRVRVGGDGKEDILALAHAAMNPSMKVTVEAESEPTGPGRFCNVIYIRLNRPGEWPGFVVTGIRAYADGNMHVFFNNNVSDACGSRVRVGGNGKGDIFALAFSSMMAKMPVIVAAESEPTGPGRFCNIIYIRLNEYRREPEYIE